MDAVSRLLGSALEVTWDAEIPSGAEILTGTPTARIAELAALPGVDVGIWEMTPGEVRDVEADEIFVVLSGRATVTVDEEESFELGAGAVVHLRAGDRTRWTVHETIRKVYVVLRGGST
jgi:uncharacterized cupin superfamily protein